MRKSIFLGMILLLISTPNAISHQGDWNGLPSYKEGWSEWSTSDQCPIKGKEGEDKYCVSQYIWLKPVSWKEEYNTSGYVTITGSNGETKVSRPKDSYTRWPVKTPTGGTSYCEKNAPMKSLSLNSSSVKACGNCDGFHAPDLHGTNHWCLKPDTSTETPGGHKSICYADNYTHCSHVTTQRECVVMLCPYLTTTPVENVCNYNNISAKYDTGCGSSITTYINETSTVFADVTKKENWNRTLAEAKGYAKRVKVYSHQNNFTVNFHNTPAEGTCEFERDGNGLVKTEKGNPVCKSAKKENGVMASQSIPFGEKVTPLNKNQYYLTGYDFVGWKINENGTKVLSDGQSINAAQVGVLPGDVLDLYPVWQKHKYSVKFERLCGNFKDPKFDNLTYTYGETVDLADLNTESCINDNGGPVTFLGWYDKLPYVNKVTQINSNQHEDLVFYAKQRQKRYYDYSNNGQWVIE